MIDFDRKLFLADEDSLFFENVTNIFTFQCEFFIKIGIYCIFVKKIPLSIVKES